MWTKIAEMLGVEREEQFEIMFKDGQIVADNVYIDSYGMCVYKKGEADIFLENELICNILDTNSDYTIRKRPYIPKELHIFYSVSDYDFTTDTSEIEELIWRNTLHQKCLLANGNVFKTEAEARKNAAKVYEKCQDIIERMRPRYIPR